MNIGQFILFIVFGLIVARTLTPYDSRYDKGKYVLVKNEKIAGILIEKQLFWERRNVQKKDRNKMSVSGFVLYIANFALIFIAIILACSPKIPCSPFVLSDEETIYLYADTLNEKIVAIGLIIVLCMTFIGIAISLLKENKLIDSKLARILVYAVAIFIILLSIGMIGVVLVELF